MRNRAEIYGANGKLKLTIPIKHLHGGFRKLDKDVFIAYDIDWQKSIGSQYVHYRSSPYFEYFESELYPFFQKKKLHFSFKY